MFGSYKEIEEYIQRFNVEAVSLKVCDLNGMMRQVTIPVTRISEALFQDGMGLGMSSYPGYRTIEESDMIIVPDPATGFSEPFGEGKILSFLCNIYSPDGSRFERDPRYIAAKAEAYAKGVLGARDILVNAELEFYVFDSVKFAITSNRSSYEVESCEGIWNTGREENPNLGYKIPRSGGQHCAPPRDHFFHLRHEMVKALEACGVKVKYHHHELGGAGQAEIELPFSPLVEAADHIRIAKYVIKNVARLHGKTVTFMPKPLFDEAGSGMHLHLYPTDGAKSLFYDPSGYAGLNDRALMYIGGLLYHTPALMAITNPSTNSFRRFTRGLAAPYNLFFSLANRSAAIRIPGYAIGPEEERLEYRIPDALSNPYLCLAAVVMAGADGIKSAIRPQEHGFGPYDVNVYTLSEEELAKMKAAPTSLEQALEALAADHDFLAEGGVFDPGFVDFWVEMKRDEALQVAQRPHPYEFYLYYDR